MAFEETGQLTLRAEHIESAVQNFKLQEFKMLPLCEIRRSTAEKNSYFDEQDSDLTRTVTTGVTGTSLGHTPRGAAFNSVQPSWEKQTEYPSKHTGTDTILWEDLITDAFNVAGRSALRVTRAVAHSQDKVIITELNTTTQTSVGSDWSDADVSLRVPKDDILTAIAGMEINEWYVLKSNGYIVMHPTNKKEALGNGGMGDAYENIVTENGRKETLLGLNLISTIAQTLGTATLGIPKIAMRWYQVSPLQTASVFRPGKDLTIDAWLYGVPALVNNNAAYKLTGI